jgi:hypothetical protein
VRPALLLGPRREPERGGEPPRVLDLALPERAELGEPVRRPVVRERERVALDVVAPRRHVPREPPRGAAPALARERPLGERERPERLAGAELRPLAGNRPPVPPGAEDAAVGELLRDEEAREPADQLVVRRVAGREPPLEQRGRGEGARAQPHVPLVLRERDPAAVPHEAPAQER